MLVRPALRERRPDEAKSLVGLLPCRKGATVASAAKMPSCAETPQVENKGSFRLALLDRQGASVAFSGAVDQEVEARRARFVGLTALSCPRKDFPILRRSDPQIETINDGVDGACSRQRPMS